MDIVDGITDYLVENKIDDIASLTGSLKIPGH